jgi:hypothetical protein
MMLQSDVMVYYVLGESILRARRYQGLDLTFTSPKKEDMFKVFLGFTVLWEYWRHLQASQASPDSPDS